MGLCNSGVCCCVTTANCCINPPRATLNVSIVAGPDTGTNFTVTWNPALGIYVGTWTSVCGQLMQLCVVCMTSGLSPSLTCPNTCDQPCCGPTVVGAGDNSCNPLSMRFVLTVKTTNTCCPTPCRGDTWTITIT